MSLSKFLLKKKFDPKKILPLPLKLSLLIAYADPELYPGTKNLYDTVNSIEDIREWQSECIAIAKGAIDRRYVLREDDGYETGKKYFLIFYYDIFYVC